MTEIQSITLENLTNKEHFELTHSITEFAEKCQAVQNFMAGQFRALAAAVEEEGRLLGIAPKSYLTGQLDQTDRARDRFNTATKLMTEALTLNPDPNVAEAAAQILTQQESLVVENRANYIKQTGQIDVLLSTLFNDYAEQLALCKMEAPFQWFKEANDRMHDLLNQRGLEQAAISHGAVADARRTTDEAYRAFIKFYNAWILVNATTLAQDDLGANLFSTEANAKIDYFKRYILKQSSSTKPEVVVPDETVPEEGGEDEGEDEGSEENPDEPNAGDSPNEGDEPNERDDPNEGGDNPNEGDEPNEGGDDTPKPVATILFRNKDYQTIYTLTRKAGEEISAEDWPSPEEEGYRWNMTRSKVNEIIAGLTTDTTITVQAVS